MKRGAETAAQTNMREKREAIARRVARRERLKAHAEVDAELLRAKFSIGTPVKVAGIRGDFKVTGYAKDGSLHVYGGTSGHGSNRSVMPDRVRKVRSK